MASMYELSSDYAALVAALEESQPDDDVTSIYDELEALDHDITAKAEAYARIIRNAEAEAESYAEEIKRLQHHKKARENMIENLKDRLNLAMITAGKKEIPTGIGKWAIRKNPPSVQIISPGDIPPEFWLPQEPKLDKKTIIDLWKQGGTSVPGTAVVRNDSLRFA